MLVGTYGNSAQPTPLEASGFFEPRMPPQLFLCIIVHATMKRGRSQEMSCTSTKMLPIISRPNAHRALE